MKMIAKTLLVTTLLLSASPVWAADTYTIDVKHTNVVWTINHFGFSNPNGKFSASDGKIVLDQTTPANSTVNVTFPIASLTTGLPDLDTHLKGKDFFNAEQFPTATFVSTKVDVTGADTANVTGTLTMHGVSKPVVLNVKLNKVGPNMFKKQTAGFSATAALKRSDFGMTAYLPGLGDDVTLNIQSEANIL